MKKRDFEWTLDFDLRGLKGERKRVGYTVGMRLVRCDCILASDHAVDDTAAPPGGRTRLRQIYVNSIPQWKPSETGAESMDQWLSRGIAADDIQPLSRALEMIELPVDKGATIYMEVEFLANARWEATIFGLLRMTNA